MGLPLVLWCMTLCTSLMTVWMPYDFPFYYSFSSSSCFFLSLGFGNSWDSSTFFIVSWIWMLSLLYPSYVPSSNRSEGYFRRILLPAQNPTANQGPRIHHYFPVWLAVLTALRLSPWNCKGKETFQKCRMFVFFPSVLVFGSIF